MPLIFANVGNIGPAFAAIVGDIFTGSAATGGFLGATIAYAFNRGVNRGLFSNEAGQGSAPIAHAAAKADNPVSEGMVSILEPFIDTILICTLTGLVILSSGVWKEKHQNVFEQTSLEILAGQYSESNDQDRNELFLYLNDVHGHQVSNYNGEIEVVAGKAVNGGFTILT